MRALLRAVNRAASALWFVLALLTITPAPALAQSAPFPARPLLVISPVQAGSAGDTSLRLFAQKLAEQIGQQVVVENTTGAAGMIGAERLARAVADGYTIGGISDSTLTYVPVLQKRAGYDALKLFEPISLLTTSTWVLVAHPSLPVRNVRELLALARRDPGRIDYASSGTGSSHQVAMEMLRAATGIKLNHVPYKGAAQAALDVQAGHVPVMFSALQVVLGPIQSGRLRALAVAAESRSALLPDVPTVAESGVPGYQFATWTGLYAPRGTPAAIVDRLAAESARALGDPALRARLGALGANARPATPAELAEFTRAHRTRMLKVIEQAGIRGE